MASINGNYECDKFREEEAMLQAYLEVDPLDWTMEENTPSDGDEEKIEHGRKDKEINQVPSRCEHSNRPQHIPCEDATTTVEHSNRPQHIPCEDATTTVEDNLFEDLADEILLHIFSRLPQTAVTKCVQVCKRWKRLGYDEVLWKEVNLDDKHMNVPGVLGSILKRGVQVLRMSKAEVLAPVSLADSDYPSFQKAADFSITQLDASMTKFSDDNLACLLFRCNSLKFLSLEGCKLALREITAISYNHELEVLNLALTVGLKPSAIDVLTRKCVKLRSLNISWTNQTRDCLIYICRCKYLEELNLSGLRGGINRAVMEKMVTCCKKLTELDFSDVTLQIGTMKLVADNCSFLRKLSISRCSDVKPEQLQELAGLSNLSHLNLFGFVNSAALERLCNQRPDIYINKETFSPIARPISTTSYEGRLWEQYTGFII